MTKIYDTVEQALAVFMFNRSRYANRGRGVPTATRPEAETHNDWCRREGVALARNLTPETRRLAAAAHALPRESDMHLALSLLRQSSDGRKLTAKQVAAVIKLADKAESQV